MCCTCMLWSIVLCWYVCMLCVTCYVMCCIVYSVVCFVVCCVVCCDVYDCPLFDVVVVVVGACVCV